MRHGGRPNAYWARQREELIHEVEDEMRHGDPDTFTSGYRAVRRRGRGGAAYVKPEDTIGDAALCWCGLPFDHDWPGRASGRKHPKESEMPTSTDIRRADLRAYNADLQEVILEAVNTYGCKWRNANNSVLIYPPDGSRPISIYARNSERQVKSARAWFVSHVLMLDEDGTPQNPLIKDGTIVLDDFERRIKAREQAEVVDEEVVRKLAEEVNSPEHTPPPKKEKEDPHGWEATRRQKKKRPAPPPQPKAPEPAAEEGSVSEPSSQSKARDVAVGWRPHVHKGRESRYFESRPLPDGGYEYRCIACREDGTEWVSTNARSLGGHARVNHTDTTNLYSKEAREKATETLRSTRRHEARVELLNALADEFGIEIGSAEQDQEITDLRKQVDDLKAERTDLQNRVTEANKRAEDVEAKLTLIREATGL